MNRRELNAVCAAMKPLTQSLDKYVADAADYVCELAEDAYVQDVQLRTFLSVARMDRDNLAEYNTEEAKAQMYVINTLLAAGLLNGER